MTTIRMLRKKAVATIMLAGLALITGHAVASGDAKARHPAERPKPHGAKKQTPSPRTAHPR